MYSITLTYNFVDIEAFLNLVKVAETAQQYLFSKGRVLQPKQLILTDVDEIDSGSVLLSLDARQTPGLYGVLVRNWCLTRSPIWS